MKYAETRCGSVLTAPSSWNAATNCHHVTAGPYRIQSTSRQRRSLLPYVVYILQTVLSQLMFYIPFPARPTLLP